jgi:hypothetical protein
MDDRLRRGPPQRLACRQQDGRPSTPTASNTHVVFVELKEPVVQRAAPADSGALPLGPR